MPEDPQQSVERLRDLVDRHNKSVETLTEIRSEIVSHYPDSPQAQKVILRHPEQFPLEYEKLQKQYREQEMQRENRVIQNRDLGIL